MLLCRSELVMPIAGGVNVTQNVTITFPSHSSAQCVQVVKSPSHGNLAYVSLIPPPSTFTITATAPPTTPPAPALIVETLPLLAGLLRPPAFQRPDRLSNSSSRTLRCSRSGSNEPSRPAPPSAAASYRSHFTSVRLVNQLPGGLSSVIQVTSGGQ